MDYPVSAGVYLSGKTLGMFFIWLIGLAMNLVANILLVPRYGMLGASIAWLIGEMSIVVLLGLVGQIFYYRLHYEWTPFMLAFFMMVLFWRVKEVIYEHIFWSIIGALTFTFVALIFAYFDIRNAVIRLQR
jgi:O-antigen/teichoic acid export membrane protein